MMVMKVFLAMGGAMAAANPIDIYDFSNPLIDPASLTTITKVMTLTTPMTVYQQFLLPNGRSFSTLSTSTIPASAVVTATIYTSKQTITPHSTPTRTSSGTQSTSLSTRLYYQIYSISQPNSCTRAPYFTTWDFTTYTSISMPSRFEDVVDPIMTLGYSTQTRYETWGLDRRTTTLVLLSAEAVPSAVITPTALYCSSTKPSPVQSETPSEVDAALKAKGLEALNTPKETKNGLEALNTSKETKKKKKLEVGKIVGIVLGAVGGLLLLGLLESYFLHFRRLAQGKSALRGGTMIWMVCTAGVGSFFVKLQDPVINEAEKRALKEWWKEKTVLKQVALWWKWAFTFKYPDVMTEVRREAREREVGMRMFTERRGDSEGNLDLRLSMQQTPFLGELPPPYQP